MAFIERTETEVRFHGFSFWDNVNEKKMISVKCVNDKLIISDTPTGHNNEMNFFISPVTQNQYLWNLLWVVNEDNKYTAFQNFTQEKPLTYFQSIITTSNDEVEKLLKDNYPETFNYEPQG